MKYASRFTCPYCGAPLRVRWWRKLGHRLRFPIFGLLYIGRVVELVIGGSTGVGDDEVIRRYFFVECKTCKKHVPVPEAP